MPKLYLTQEPIPLADLPDKQPPIGAPWPQRYRVTKVVQSTTPRVHDALSENEAKVYCTAPDWTVDIT